MYPIVLPFANLESLDEVSSGSKTKSSYCHQTYIFHWPLRGTGKAAGLLCKLLSWSLTSLFRHKYGYIRDERSGGELSLPSEKRPAIYAVCVHTINFTQMTNQWPRYMTWWFMWSYLGQFCRSKSQIKKFKVRRIKLPFSADSEIGRTNLTTRNEMGNNNANCKVVSVNVSPFFSLRVILIMMIMIIITKTTRQHWQSYLHAHPYRQWIRYGRLTCTQKLMRWPA